MTTTTSHGHDDLELDRLLNRSTDLSDALIAALRLEEAGDWSAPCYGMQTALLAAELSLEHASALRMLMATGHPRSATATMRMQLEAMVRSAWATWAATPAEIDLLEQDLTTASEGAARRVGEYAVMKKALLQSDCPRGLVDQIATFDKVIWRSLNSFVHGGIHPLRHGQDGFPLGLAIQVVQTSNAVVTMAVAMLSKLTGEDRGLDEMNRIIPTFADCLPELSPSEASKPPTI